MLEIEGLRSKRALKRRSYTLRKRPLKDLRFSLRIFFFKCTNEKISLEASELSTKVFSPSRRFLDYEYCELPMWRMQKEVKVYDNALLVRGWRLSITQGIYLDCNTWAADNSVIVRYFSCKNLLFTSKCFLTGALQLLYTISFFFYGAIANTAICIHSGYMHGAGGLYMHRNND